MSSRNKAAGWKASIATTRGTTARARTLAKIQWEVAGTLSFSDVITAFFLAAFAWTRFERGDGRLLDLVVRARLEAVCGEEQCSLDVLRVLDGRLRGGLAAAVVDRLGLEADVHGEPLARADRAERDLHGARLPDQHVRRCAGAAVVAVAVDAELRLAP